jgi:murein DD-endopeptidase MepM/ murein hydrolase activator NlpD
VVVYAGWNDYGYGNLVILDHGNGWQSLYAHLNTVGVGCGQSVFQSSTIGGMGCTGNCTGTHLHFEMQSDIYGKVNPLNFLP